MLCRSESPKLASWFPVPSNSTVPLKSRSAPELISICWPTLIVPLEARRGTASPVVCTTFRSAPTCRDPLPTSTCGAPTPSSETIVKSPLTSRADGFSWTLLSAAITFTFPVTSRFEPINSIILLVVPTPVTNSKSRTLITADSAAKLSWLFCVSSGIWSLSVPSVNSNMLPLSWMVVTTSLPEMMSMWPRVLTAPSRLITWFPTASKVTWSTSKIVWPRLTSATIVIWSAEMMADPAPLELVIKFPWTIIDSVEFSWTSCAVASRIRRSTTNSGNSISVACVASSWDAILMLTPYGIPLIQVSVTDW